MMKKDMQTAARLTHYDEDNTTEILRRFVLHWTRLWWHHGKYP